MSDNLKSLIFTIVLCAACSLLLTAASTSLKPIQDKNIVLNMQQNILKAAGYINEGTAIDKAQTEKLYSEKIFPASLKTDEKDLKFFLKYDKPDLISGYIIPLESNGLWGKIYGYIALEKDGKTISGVSIYSHQETPGLGGEIEKSPFLNDFKNKLILDENGTFKGVKVAKGKALVSVAKEERPFHVDGISGATLTGKYLSQGLVSTLGMFEPVSEKFRNGEYDFNNKQGNKQP